MAACAPRSQLNAVSAVSGMRSGSSVSAGASVVGVSWMSGRPAASSRPARKRSTRCAIDDPAVPGIEPGEATSTQVAIRRAGVDATPLAPAPARSSSGEGDRGTRRVLTGDDVAHEPLPPEVSRYRSARGARRGRTNGTPRAAAIRSASAASAVFAPADDLVEQAPPRSRHAPRASSSSGLAPGALPPGWRWRRSDGRCPELVFCSLVYILYASPNRVKYSGPRMFSPRESSPARDRCAGERRR